MISSYILLPTANNFKGKGERKKAKGGIESRKCREKIRSNEAICVKIGKTLVNKKLSSKMAQYPDSPLSSKQSQVSVEQLQERLLSGADKIQLIDVREPQEIDIARIEGFVNLPLSEFAAWGEQIHTQFDCESETLVLCHHGVRSAQMCQWLVNQGFTNVKNITGGIAAYSSLVDPSIPQY